jgi:PST family polysaccharide transporter
VLPPDGLRSKVALTNEHDSEPPRSGHLTSADIRRRAFSGAMLLGVKAVVVQALGLASTILIAHYLTPGALGEVAFGIMLTTLVAFVGGNQGLAGALIRRQEPPDARDLETALGLQLAIGLAIAFVVAAVALPFGTVGDLTALMVWAIPITACRVPAQTVLERDLAYRRLVSAEVAEVVLFQIWQIATVVAGWGVWGLATAVLWRAVTGTGVLVALTPDRYLRPRFDRGRSRRLLGIGLKIQATDLVDGLRDQGVNMSTAAIGGLPVLGLWSMAYRALQLPFMVFFSLYRVSLPAMSRLLALGRDPRPLIEDSVGLIAPPLGVVLVPMAACSPALFPAVLGERWAGAAGAIPPVCLGLMVAGPVLIAGIGYLWAIGDGKVPLRGSIYCAIAWFAVSLPLLPSLGATAVGFGLGAGFVAQTVVIVHGLRRHVRLSFRGPLLVPTAIAVAATTPAWIAARSVHPTLFVTAATAAGAAALYLGALFLFHRQVMRKILSFGLRPLVRRSPSPLAGIAASR